MTYLHNVTVGRRRITIDGVPITCSQEVTVEPSSLLHQITLTVFCRNITLEGDSHTGIESTPIYDELVAGATSDQTRS